MKKRMLIMLALATVFMTGIGVIKVSEIHTGMTQMAMIAPPPAAVTTALEKARRATELAPKDAVIAQTYGVALYRAGKFENAIAIFEKVDNDYVKSGIGSNPANWAFVAMSQFKLNKVDDARRSLARSKELAKNNKQTQAEFVAHLREAEELIEDKALQNRQP